MTAFAPQAPHGPPAASTSRFIATFAIILLSIAGLLAADTVLARVDRRESQAHAASLYREGAALLARGDVRGAIDRLTAAVESERDNVTYQLALAQAMLAGGRPQDAETTLLEVLKTAEIDGAANMAMARVLTRQARYEEAKAYYHRAIYGRWGADSVPARATARFELIDLLARRQDNEALVAELLPFQVTPPADVALRRRIGRLFTQAGSPARGAAMFRDILRDHPRDADAYAGLGQADLALGNLHAAHAEFGTAARFAPGDAVAKAGLMAVDSAISLNPVEVGLSIAEREARAGRLLAMTVSALSKCSRWPPAEVVEARDSAVRLSAPVPGRRMSLARVDSMTGLAVDLWKSRPSTCATSVAPGQGPLQAVLVRIAR